MEVRLMELGDIPFFNKVRSESYKFLHDTTNYSFKQNLDWFTKSNPKYFIVSNNQVDIGYFRTSNWTLESIWLGLDIAEKYRGKGYAKQAYNSFIKYIKTLGIQEVYLEVLETNKRAKHIYEGLGFAEIGRTTFEKNTSIKMKLIF